MKFRVNFDELDVINLREPGPMTMEEKFSNFLLQILFLFSWKLISKNGNDFLPSPSHFILFFASASSHRNEKTSGIDLINFYVVNMLAQEIQRILPQSLPVLFLFLVPMKHKMFVIQNEASPVGMNKLKQILAAKSKLS